MSTLDGLLAQIRAADHGPRTVAAFDYDGTLIAGYSAGAFYEHRIRKGDMGPFELARTALIARRGIADDADFATFFNMSLAAWRDISVEELEALGDKLFKDQIAAKLHHEALALVEAHREMGHTLVLASSAMRFQTEPMARELGIDHVLHTEVQTADGCLTGKVEGKPLWGAEKARVVRELAASVYADLDGSFAYSNGREDVPLLESVGHPVAIEPDAELFAEASLRGWPVLRCEPGAGRPGPVDVARTAAFWGGMLTSVGVGVGVGLVRRSRSTVVDVGMGVGSDVSLTLAGVDVRVLRGAEHLWSQRPAIFIFNHQTKMDPIVVMKLVRENFTGVAKASAKNIPVFGQLFQLGGVAFVERSGGSGAEARKALEPVVARLRGGTSLIVAPEGTRTPTPRLGAFKKGPFHIAQQAQVPIVPIVLKGIHTVQSRGGQIVRPGSVEVVVLPPVSTVQWRSETVGEHRDEVRDAMATALRDWPTEIAALGPGA